MFGCDSDGGPGFASGTRARSECLCEVQTNTGSGRCRCNSESLLCVCRILVILLQTAAAMSQRPTHLRSNKRGVFYVKAESYLKNPEVQKDLARTHEVFVKQAAEREKEKQLPAAMNE